MLNPGWLDAAYMSYAFPEYFRQQPHNPQFAKGKIYIMWCHLFVSVNKPIDFGFCQTNNCTNWYHLKQINFPLSPANFRIYFPSYISIFGFFIFERFLYLSYFCSFYEWNHFIRGSRTNFIPSLIKKQISFRFLAKICRFGFLSFIWNFSFSFWKEYFPSFTFQTFIWLKLLQWNTIN